MAKITYPSESAGRLLIKNVPVIDEHSTIDHIRRMLAKDSKNFETINYIYAVDKNQKLKGIVSVRDIFSADKDLPIKRLFPKKIISVRAHTDQEKVALLALQHNLKSVPVVDKDDCFLGVISSDRILKIIDTESVENTLKMGGVIQHGSFDNIFNLPLLTSLKHRLPWLILGLVGGFLAAGIVNQFEDVISKNLILAAFIPLIVYMADAVGTQMEAFIIRDLAIDPKLSFAKYFSRQTFIVLLIAVLVSFLLYGASLLLYKDAAVSIVLSVALFCAILTSLMTGLVVPYLFGKLNLDPANASGPIATIIQDILSVLVYFVIASMIL